MGLLRLILAMCVVIGHLRLGKQFALDGGDAVKIFFAISGFYMGLILKSKYEVKNWEGMKRFWIARYLRLYPLYIVILALSIIWYITLEYLTNGRTPDFPLLRFSSYFSPFENFILWLSNILIIGIDIPSLLGLNINSDMIALIGSKSGSTMDNPDIIWMGWMVWVRQAWSLGTELWFYLATPFIVRLGSFGLGLLGILAFFTGKMWNSISGGDSYYFTPYLFVFFIIGILLNRIYNYLKLSQNISNFPLGLKIALRSTPIIWAVILPATGIKIGTTITYLIFRFNTCIVCAHKKRSC
ncbi:acyltransferase [Synechococcus sp. EJ6-Ellesmere]|uniref:acyltransferase family protein n=1 Tax=Synechococcus sp. EJ6-Ellesmere TaxID=2823734 RepID=UPI0020CC7D4F|nr:acyltransferase family protein [Synechococcus sp. EJ6-Ellesmere]MCP9826496.1 acyltransferase [Synechococcus sp. EJ6-Ellesmere]